MRTFAITSILALMAGGCTGRPLLYQIAPSEQDQACIAAFQMIDTAGKGQLTRAEVDDYFRRRFSELDRNRDGFITNDEAGAGVPILGMNTAREMVLRLDGNMDGKLSLDEFMTISNYLFVRDENRDGVLTSAEVKTPPVEHYVPVGKRGPNLEGRNPAGPRQ